MDILFGTDIWWCVVWWLLVLYHYRVTGALMDSQDCLVKRDTGWVQYGGCQSVQFGKIPHQKCKVYDFKSSFMVLHCCTRSWTLVFSIESKKEPDLKGVLMNNRLLFAWETTPLDVFKFRSKTLLLRVISHRTGFQMKSLSYWGFTFLDYCLDTPKGWISFK